MAIIRFVLAKLKPDLPSNEPRFVSRARGVEWSLVNGQPVLERGRVVEQPAGKRPGQVLRHFDA